MNYLLINDLTDLSFVLEQKLYISGNSLLLNEEIYTNMWVLAFAEPLIEKLQVSNLEEFLIKLLQIWSMQLLKIHPHTEAIFYLWFDKKALQLRFNIISAVNLKLPFGCTVNILSSPISIFEDFITMARHVAFEGDNIKYYDSEEEMDNDPEFADIDEEEEGKNYVLDVYQTLIPQSEEE